MNTAQIDEDRAFNASNGRTYAKQVLVEIPNRFGPDQRPWNTVKIA